MSASTAACCSTAFVFRQKEKVMEGGTYINPIGEVATYGTIAFAKEKTSTVEIDEDDIHICITFHINIKITITKKLRMLF